MILVTKTSDQTRQSVCVCVCVRERERVCVSIKLHITAQSGPVLSSFTDSDLALRSAVFAAGEWTAPLAVSFSLPPSEIF